MTESAFAVFHPDSADLMSILLQRLAVIDPCFEEEQRQFQLTLECMKKALKKEANMSVEAYISSLDILFSSKLLYIAWMGISWNLDCFRNPAAKLRLDSDYEDLHGEMFFFRPFLRSGQRRTVFSKTRNVSHHAVRNLRKRSTIFMLTLKPLVLS